MTKPAISPDGETLQFDRAEPVDAAQGADSSVTARCGECGTSLRAEYYDVGGVAACAPCKDRIVEHAKPLRAWGPMLRAVLFGFVAAIAGAVIYYGVIAITNFEIGLVAILTGYMVGWGVRRGAGGRGGRRLQIAAAGLTYLSVALAYTPLALKGAAESDAAAADSVQAVRAIEPHADSTAVVALQGAADSTGAPAAAVEWIGPIGFVIAAGLILALPLVMVFGSLPSGLISALIIAFGMHQAWRMTGVGQVVVSGPLSVGPPGDAAVADEPAV